MSEGRPGDAIEEWADGLDLNASYLRHSYRVDGISIAKLYMITPEFFNIKFLSNDKF